MMNNKNLRIYFFGWLTIFTFLHIPAFKVDIQGMHSARQAYTQTNILNFAEEDFNIFNPRLNTLKYGTQIFRMEFPIMQWLFGGVYKASDTDHIIISRILSLLLGILSVLGIYFFVQFWFQDKLIAAISAWFFSFAPTFYYYTIGPMPDNFALCTGIWSLVVFSFWTKNRHPIAFLGAAILMMFTTAAKLPFLLNLMFPVVYFIKEVWTKKEKIATESKYLFILVSLQIPPLLWYAWVIPTWGENPVVKGIFSDNSEWYRALDYFQHHLISTLPENLVNYAALLPFLTGIFIFFKQKIFSKKKALPFIGWTLLYLSFFLFEINVIGKVHDYYFMPVLPMIAIIVALGSKFLWYSSSKISRPLLVLCILVVPFTAYLRMNPRWDWETRKTWQVHRDEFQKHLPSDAILVVGNDNAGSVLLYYFDRNGWSFGENYLPSEQLQQYIQSGATHLVSNSRTIDENPELKSYLKGEPIQIEEFRIFELGKK